MFLLLISIGLSFSYRILGSCVISHWYLSCARCQTELEVALLLIENSRKYYCQVEVVLELRIVLVKCVMPADIQTDNINKHNAGIFANGCSFLKGNCLVLFFIFVFLL